MTTGLAKEVDFVRDLNVEILSPLTLSAENAKGMRELDLDVSIVDHGALTGLGDVADHLFYLLTNGTRDVTGDMLFDTNVKALFRTDSYVNSPDTDEIEVGAVDLFRVNINAFVEAEFSSDVLEFRQSSGKKVGFRWVVNSELTVNINSAVEVTFAANIMTFNNGAVDTSLDWSTNGELDLKVGASTIITVAAASVTFTQGIISTVAGGTQPYACTSTDLNTNLHADILDSLHVGTNGAAIPDMSAANTWTGVQTIGTDKKFQFRDSANFLYSVGPNFLIVNAGANLIFSVGGSTKATLTSGLAAFTQDVSSPNYVSTIATGTQPYACTSTTLNTNLNVDLLDGAHVGVSGATIPLLNTENTWGANQLIADGFGLVIGHTAQIDFGATPEFQVLGTEVPDSSMGFATFKNGASEAPDIRFLKSRGATIGSNVLVQDGDRLGRIRFQGADGNDFNTTAAEFQVEVDGVASLNNVFGRFVWGTRTSGGLNEKMRLSAAGQLGIGTAVPNQLLTVEGAMSLKEQVSANADVASYGQLWVKDTAPNELWFTNDAGTDIQLGLGGGPIVSTTEVFSGTSPTSWTNLDLSGTVGAQSRIVALSFKSGSDMNALAVRKDGDTNEYYGVSVEANAYGVQLGHHDGDVDMVLFVPTSSSGIIEWITETAQTCTVDILWYI